MLRSTEPTTDHVPDLSRDDDRPGLLAAEGHRVAHAPDGLGPFPAGPPRNRDGIGAPAVGPERWPGAVASMERAYPGDLVLGHAPGRRGHDPGADGPPPALARGDRDHGRRA